ncbi:hypothetical protein M0802_000175 [Mischocyttarus mexicanus]|nr:hypothetical protein M0802_000175 [Mischocyttarus mexicanus]
MLKYYRCVSRCLFQLGRQVPTICRIKDLRTLDVGMYERQRNNLMRTTPARVPSKPDISTYRLILTTMKAYIMRTQYPATCMPATKSDEEEEEEDEKGRERGEGKGEGLSTTVLCTTTTTITTTTTTTIITSDRIVNVV